MKVKNETEWLTRDLKRVLCEALRRNSKIEGPLKKWQKKGLIVEIVYSRKGYYSGNAQYNGCWMKLRIPKDKIKKSDFVSLFIHELDHTRGFHHNQIAGGRYLRTESYPWVEDNTKFPIRKKEIIPKEKPDLQIKRYKHVLEIIKQKERIIKRLSNSLKKWRKKRKYYEKVLIAAGKIKESSKN